MSDAFAGMIVGGALVLAFALLYSRMVGCGGGHHYEEEHSRRVRITPFHNKDKWAAQEVITYQCSHEGCTAETTERTLYNEIDEDEYEDIKDELGL